MRCGSCNEVFDGNAALCEPLASPPPAFAPAPAVAAPPSAFDQSPSPSTAPFDQNDGGQAGYADDALNAEPIYTLQLDTALDQADDERLAEPKAEVADDVAAIDAAQADAYAEDMSAPAREPEEVQHYWQQVEPELEPEPEFRQEPEFAQAAADAGPASAEPASDNPLDIKPMTHEELEAALAAELAQMEQSIATDAVDSDSASDNHAAPTRSTSPAERQEPTLPPDSRYDLDEADEEALVQLAAARERDLVPNSAPATHTLLRSVSSPSQDRYEPPVEIHSVREPEPPAKQEEPEDPNEPGFVKRDRKRERYGKTTTIAMSVGALLLVGALALQTMTTFRNQLAANYPALKPTLQNICGAFGCKIELPAQIDALVIEQGELQTLSESTFSFTTLLRNQSGSAQTWPHIELVLDDANDKAILRRVFTPRDYLGNGAALEQGFAPRSEQSVKLYFELKQLKASGYHIAVFYP